MSPVLRSDARVVSTALAQRIDLLVRELLPGGRRQGPEWRCGSVAGEPGQSMAVHLGGAKSGVWSDFSTGEVGDALDLVAAVLFRGDLADALRWSRAWLGLGDGRSPTQVQRAEPIASPPPDAEDREQRRQGALRIYLEAQPIIAGTPAAAYLAGRGIDLAELGRQPRALRFHSGLYNRESSRPLPALVAAVSDASGAHAATHRTWLEQDERGRWVKARLANPKMSVGPIAGGCVRLWRGASGKALRDAPAGETVVIGEGIETCLSIALACPELRVLAAISLGNMGRVQLPPQIRNVILAADNDRHPRAVEGLQRAIEAHLTAGRDVRVARSAVGKDFNDVLVAYRAADHAPGVHNG